MWLKRIYSSTGVLDLLSKSLSMPKISCFFGLELPWQKSLLNFNSWFILFTLLALKAAGKAKTAEAQQFFRPNQKVYNFRLDSLHRPQKFPYSATQSGGTASARARRGGEGSIPDICHMLLCRKNLVDMFCRDLRVFWWEKCHHKKDKYQVLR